MPWPVRRKSPPYDRTSTTSAGSCLVRRLHHAAVRVLHDDVRDLDGRRAEAEQDGGVDAGGARRATRAAAGAGAAAVQTGTPQPVVPRLDNLRATLRAQLAARLQRQIQPGKVGLGSRSARPGRQHPRGRQLRQSAAPSCRTARAALLAEIAAPLSELSHPVRIEGHTDDMPIRTARFRSNWELSTARATKVIVFLQNDRGLPAARLSAAGYGEFHPRVAERRRRTARAQNRRVDLVILNTRDEPPARRRRPAPALAR